MSADEVAKVRINREDKLNIVMNLFKFTSCMKDLENHL